MAFTEFYVTHGSAASDLNGGGVSLGADDGPIITNSNCSMTEFAAGATYDIENLDNTGWGSAAVEDFLVFDTDGYQDILRIDTLSQGGDSDVIRCTSIAPTTPGGSGLSGQPVRVGGAWATIQHAMDTIDNINYDFHNSSGDLTRINIKNDADYDQTVASTGLTATGGSRIVFSGYSSTPGDSGRATINPSGTGDVPLTITISGDQRYTNFHNLILRRNSGDTAVAIQEQADNTASRTYINCDFIQSGTNLSVIGGGMRGSHAFVDCYFDVSAGSHASRRIMDNVSGSQYLGCTFVGGEHATQGTLARIGSTFVNCVIRDCASGMYATNNVSNRVINCTFHNITGHAIYATDPGAPYNVIHNCIFTNCGSVGDVDLAGDSKFLLTNCLFGTGDRANTERFPDAGSASTGDIDADPLYENIGYSDLRLSECSPGIQAGAGRYISDLEEISNVRTIGAMEHASNDRGASAYAENKILDYVFRNTADWAPATIYLALYSDNPCDDNTSNELNDAYDGGYAREVITFDASSSGDIQNSADVTFNQSTSDWSDITHFAIFDALTNGNMLAHGKLTTAATVTSGETFRVVAGNLTIKLR